MVAIMLGLVVFGLFAPAASAAQTHDKLTVNSVDSSGYPKVVVRLTVSNPRGQPVPPAPENFQIVENGQDVGPVAAYALALSPTAAVARYGDRHQR